MPISTRTPISTNKLFERRTPQHLFQPQPNISLPVQPTTTTTIPTTIPTTTNNKQQTANNKQQTTNNKQQTTTTTTTTTSKVEVDPPLVEKVGE